MTPHKQITIITSIPPPIGGNTIHAQRLKDLLTRDGLTVELFDYRPRPIGDGQTVSPKLLFLKMWEFYKHGKAISRDSVVHVHVSAMNKFRWFAPFLLFAFRRQKKIVSVHGGSFVVENESRFKRFYLSRLIPLFQHVITVNSDQKEFLSEIGIQVDKIDIIPAYIQVESADESLVPENIRRLAEEKVSVLTSGQIQEIYNYEVLLEAISGLNRDKFHFVFALYGIIEPEYWMGIKSKIDSLQEHYDIAVLHNQRPEVFSSLMNVADIYVRTTTEDGDAVAVREAIASNTTVLATDCVDRPKECLLFKHGDPGSLLIAFDYIGEHATDPSRLQEQTNYEKILSVYGIATRRIVA